MPSRDRCLLVSYRALFYLAQHHDKLGNTGEALRLVDCCIEVRLGSGVGWTGGGVRAGARCGGGGGAGRGPSGARGTDGVRDSSAALQPRGRHANQAACLDVERQGFIFVLWPGTSPHAALARWPTALQHTPTLIEAYVAKARFLKHAGGLWAESMQRKQLAGYRRLQPVGAAMLRYCPKARNPVAAPPPARLPASAISSNSRLRRFPHHSLLR